MKKAEKLFKELLNENLGYIDLKPINKIEATPKADFENKFAEFLAEEAKVEEKKVTKEVEEVAEHNYDYKDPKNLDNQIGQEVMNGVYFEAKQNPAKTIEEIKEIVAKNLAKDGQYYMKNAAFGVEGIGYEDTELEEVSGKYAASGYSDKLKKVVKESLGGVVKEGIDESVMNAEFTKKRISDNEYEIFKNDRKQMTFYGSEEEVDGYLNLLKKHGKNVKFENINKALGQVVTSGNPNSLAAQSGNVIRQMMAEKEEVEESYDEFQRDDKGAKGVDKRNKGEEDAFGAGVAKGEKIEKKKAKKAKKESLDNDLAEIDKQAQIVALEAKLDKMEEVIETKLQRINMVSEDDNLKDLVDGKKMKAIQKEVKVLEKRKAKMEKMYEKMCGKKYQREEIVDEIVDNIETEEVHLENE